MDLLELLLAQVTAHLVQAVPAIAGFKLLPRSPVLSGKACDAEEHGRRVPVALEPVRARLVEGACWAIARGFPRSESS